MSNKFPGGVATGDDVQAIFNDALENEYALPAVNVVGTNSVNAVLEAAAQVKSPVMIQFSNGGGIFYAGKSLSNDDQKAAIAGSVSKSSTSQRKVPGRTEAARLISSKLL